MSVLTALLAAIFFAAWKAPRWVKEIGEAALALSVFSLVLCLRQMFEYLQGMDTVQFNIVCGGLKVALIPVLYGIIIYMVSLVVRIIQKPRL